jgi:NAD(P)-dependent dehydrogenase (short-subunit alcohol dehydrogenase family)
MDRAHRFQDKVVLITGGAGGIGLATARRFLLEKAKVVLVDLDHEKLQAAVQKLKEEDRAAEILPSPCDVSHHEEVERTVNFTLERFGRLDVVVNNAGLMVFKKLEDHTQEDWMRVLSVDLMGAFHFTKQAFLHMPQGGAIVNVSSVHAVETTPMVTSYAAAKAAILSLTRSAALEGKPKAIRVNAVLPGAVDTPMLWQNPNIKAGLEVVHKTDVGQPSDLASVIAFLASEEACFVQGTSLLVDGGRLARL